MGMLNLTPHAVTCRLLDGTLREYAPSGAIARVSVIDTPTNDVLGGLPVVTQRPGPVIGVPSAYECSDICIVSRMVLDAYTGDQYVVAPDTGATCERDAQGRIVAMTRWVGRR